MKLIHATRVAAAALVLAFAAGAQAQAQAGSETQPAAAATEAPSLKAAKAANRALARKVRHALARTKGLDPSHIYVKAVDGTITLTGNCTSQQEIDLAGGVVAKVAGVASVKNELSVKTPR